MGQVFVSYKHDAIDIEFVNELEARLIQAEILPWTDRQLHGGIEWIRKIDLEIKASVAVIIVITPASLKSQYVTYEWSFGKGLGKTLIPILLKAPTAEDEVEIHPVLEILQLHNFTDSANANWQKLIDEILDLMGREDIPPAVTQAIKLLDS